MAGRRCAPTAQPQIVDSSWFDGPPFAVAEEVFDEHDIEACALVPDSGTGRTALS
jgi:hypothetical protein